ncbi:MAG TPA: tetratricopeptide repeat protein, partial [Nannocystaceae bacterium]|nr:tetratricopeptide repeat protein [Nannocystaceae bacterium]
ATITDVIADADAIGDDDLRARALVDGVWISGVDLYRADDARRLAAFASGAIERAGLVHALGPGLHEALGLAAMYEGNNAVARTELQLALDGTEAPQARATLHANLASVMLRERDAKGAVTELERALAQLDTPTLDDPHARAGVLNNLGYALLAADRPADALVIHRRSLGLREQLSGADSLEAANASGGVGLALLALAQPKEARAPLERALAIRLAHEGRPEDLAEVRFGLARALDSTDPRARELARAALATYQSPELGQSYAREAASVAAWLAQATPR